MRHSAPRIAAEWLVIILLASAVGYMLTTRLATMPGLHGDEAWFGLRAWKMATGHGASIHGMNGYTGAAFPYLVSLAFRALGPSQLSLRSVGVLCNLLTLTVLASTCAFVRKSREGGVVFLLLAGTSLIVTSELRIAWEVTALNPLIASVLLFTSVAWADGGSGGGLPRRTLALGCTSLFLLSALGTFSHFIFVVFCIGLLVAGVTNAARSKTTSALQLAAAQCASLANLSVLVVAKLWLFKEALSPAFALGGFAVALVLEALILARVLSNATIISLMRSRLDRAARALRWLLTGYFAVGGIAFAVTHSAAFVQTLANDVLVRRFYSVPLPSPLLLLSFGYVAGLMVVYGGALVRLARDGHATSGETFLLVLPVASAAVLPLFVHANAIRHYVLIALSLLTGVCVPLSRLEGIPRRAAMWALFGYGVALNAFVLSILRDPRHYDGITPMHFRLGHSVETSAHFLRLDDVFARMASDGVASPRTTEPFFIGGPLGFYALSTPVKAVSGAVATINYDYAHPTGLSYALSPAEGKVGVR